MVFFTVIGMLFLSGMEVDLFIPSYPELQAEFGLTPFIVQLCLSLNFLAICIGSLYAGTLGDRYGMGVVIQYSLAVFIGGSVLCVFAPNFEIILLGRILQGLGIAAPAALSYAIVIGHYPQERQASMLGILSGCVTTAMAIAPVIGSYVTQYAGWRGNFMVLLGMGIAAFVLSWRYLPKDQAQNKDSSLSLKAYKPLLHSKILWKYVIIMIALSCSYWIFIAMGPILYMDGMGVSLDQFGLYQGSLAASYSLCSFLSPRLLDKFGQHRCYRYGLIFMMIWAILMGAVAIFVPDDPLLITILASVLGLPMVFPSNILYVDALQLVPQARSKIGAFRNVIRLAGTALGIQFVSYLYDGRFIHVALLMGALTIVAFILGRQLHYWKITKESAAA